MYERVTMGVKVIVHPKYLDLEEILWADAVDAGRPWVGRKAEDHGHGACCLDVLGWLGWGGDGG